PGGVLLPEASASLDVSEEEGHGLDGCRAHAPSLSRGWPTSRPGRPVRRPPRFLGFSSGYAVLMNCDALRMDLIGVLGPPSVGQGSGKPEARQHAVVEARHRALLNGTAWRPPASTKERALL